MQRKNYNMILFIIKDFDQWSVTSPDLETYDVVDN